MRVNKANCTQIVIGRIKDKKVKGLDFPTIIWVEYQVDGKTYVLKDTIKYKVELIKIGFLPIGQRNYAKMGDTRVGSLARVSYNPYNPSEAFLTDNIGIINC